MIDKNEQPEKIIKISGSNSESLFSFCVNIVLCILCMILLIAFDGYDVAILIVPPLLWALGLLVFVFFIPIMFHNESIYFYKNRFKHNFGMLGSDVYKYSTFQKAYLTKDERIILKTENEKEIHGFAGCSQKVNSMILTELYHRGKEVIIDDLWCEIYKIPSNQSIENKIHWSTKFGVFYAISMFFIVGYISHADMKLKINETYYDNGTLKSKSEFRNTTGVKKEYYENGNLKIEGEFKYGKQNGVVKEYDKNGTLRVETEFKDGKQDGIRKEYSEQGHLIVESTFSNDKQHGITKEFYESGALKSEAQFNDGIENGIDKRREALNFIMKTEK